MSIITGRDAETDFLGNSNAGPRSQSPYTGKSGGFNKYVSDQKKKFGLKSNEQFITSDGQIHPNILDAITEGGVPYTNQEGANFSDSLRKFFYEVIGSIEVELEEIYPGPENKAKRREILNSVELYNTVNTPLDFIEGVDAMFVLETDEGETVTSFIDVTAREGAKVKDRNFQGIHVVKLDTSSRSESLISDDDAFAAGEEIAGDIAGQIKELEQGEEIRQEVSLRRMMR